MSERQAKAKRKSGTSENKDAGKKTETITLNQQELVVLRQFLSKTPTNTEHESDIRKALAMKLERMIKNGN